jgi:DnaJ family protein C protein 1
LKTISFFLLLALPSPQLTDILPIKFAHFLVNQQFFIPYFKTLLFRRRIPPDEELSPDDDQDQTKSTTKKSPVVRIPDIVPEMAVSRNAPVVSYLTTNSSSSSENTQSTDSIISTQPWSDEEKQLLCKTIVRFPPGIPRRWEKIADAVGRPVSQVTDMAKQIQNTVGVNSNIFQEHLPSPSSTVTIDQNIITERQQYETVWSQTDQQLLECALKNIPKDTPSADRWEQIARCIPGKTREECLARYRYIVQLVKAKKTA